jgi:hypothetical protein
MGRGRVLCVVLLTMCLLVQLGDGSTTQRGTPVAVVGLSSGVAMVALGYVSFFATAAQLMLVCERPCVCLIDGLWRRGGLILDGACIAVFEEDNIGTCDEWDCSGILARCRAAARCLAGEAISAAR